ncbi:MAG: hypothetical protein JRH15_08345 [Deltaproteobacteria bacterium]|nr:hypothetical protein [Deltaproteobacteria bacterium]
MGHRIKKYSRYPNGYVYLNGDQKIINANIHTLSAYSAHADQNGLVSWVESMVEKPIAITLVHGEPDAKSALAKNLESKGYQLNSC